MSSPGAIAFGQLVVAEARLWIDTPFVWLGAVRGVGCDCKGLIAGVARALGRSEGDSLAACAADYRHRVDAHRLAAGLAELFDPIRGAGALPGDILLLRIAGIAQHLAIVSAATAGVPCSMVHALNHRPCRVREVPIDEWWRARIAGVWRWREQGAGV